jgi:hypothetical protein
MHQESPNTSLQTGHALRGRPISQFRPPLRVIFFSARRRRTAAGLAGAFAGGGRKVKPEPQRRVQ